MAWKYFGLFSLVVSALAPQASAASLGVSPVRLEVQAPGAATTLTLQNRGPLPINVQARVFRWTQKNGVESLEATREVVVSPPMTMLSPGARQVVRVVRVAKKTFRGEEAYRIVVDELPVRARMRPGTVALVARFSIPAFFYAPQTPPAAVAWSVSRRGNTAYLSAANQGGSSLRLADVALAQGGRNVFAKNGLLGYVLGGSTMSWPVASASRISGGGLKLNAMSAAGPYRANVAALR